MKYITVEKESEDMKWSRVYCNCNGTETSEDIAKAIVTEYFVGSERCAGRISLDLERTRKELLVNNIKLMKGIR